METTKRRKRPEYNTDETFVDLTIWYRPGFWVLPNEESTPYTFRLHYSKPKSAKTTSKFYIIGFDGFRAMFLFTPSSHRKDLLEAVRRAVMSFLEVTKEDLLGLESAMGRGRSRNTLEEEKYNVNSL